VLSLGSALDVAAEGEERARKSHVAGRRRQQTTKGWSEREGGRGMRLTMAPNRGDELPTIALQWSGVFAVQVVKGRGEVVMISSRRGRNGRASVGEWYRGFHV
jgi:hypothetical protein